MWRAFRLISIVGLVGRNFKDSASRWFDLFDIEDGAPPGLPS